jgi:hypothetical protein
MAHRASAVAVGAKRGVGVRGGIFCMGLVELIWMANVSGEFGGVLLLFARYSGVDQTGVTAAKPFNQRFCA